MSIQALAWVFEQDIPSRAKSVLFALANHADPVTGHCYPRISVIMREASCSRQAVFNFISLLRRNGFIDVRPRQRADGARKSNDYWLLFDRVESKWQTFAGRHEPEEIEENSIEEQIVAETEGGGYTQRTVENMPLTPPCVLPESDLRTPIIDPSDSNRQSLQLRDGQTRSFGRPKEFSPHERAKQQAAEQAQKAQTIGVIQGSKPWDAWVRHGHPSTLVGTILVNGNRHRGWLFPTLYPPKATGPPPHPTLTEADEEELAHKWG